MDRKDLERMWRDPKNYKWKSVYYCKEDPRVIVPKLVRWAGWTVNFAHPRAYWVLASLFLIALVPPAIALFAWPRTEEAVVASLIFGGIAVVAYCIYQNSKC